MAFESTVVPFDYENTTGNDITMPQLYMDGFSFRDNYTYSSYTDVMTFSEDPPMPLWQVIFFAILASIGSLVTITGNLIVLLSFVIERSIRQPTNYFIASLAVSDLIIGTVSMPFYTLYLLSDKKWLLGEIVCDLWLSIDYTVCLCSIYTVFCITIDRFCSVKIPAKYRNWRSQRKVAVIVTLTWTIPILVFFTTIFGWQYFVGVRTVPQGECYVQYMENPLFNCFLQLGYFWITLIVMCFLYSGIYRVALNLQRKSEAKHKKMTTLVSVAGQEISKIGIGVTQRPSVTHLAKDKLADGRPHVPKKRQINRSYTDDDDDDDDDDYDTKKSVDQRKPARIPAVSGCKGVPASRGKVSNITEDRSSSPAFASDSSQSPNPFKALPPPPSYNQFRQNGNGRKTENTGKACSAATNIPPSNKSSGTCSRQERGAVNFMDEIAKEAGHISAESVDNFAVCEENSTIHPSLSNDEIYCRVKSPKCYENRMDQSDGFLEECDNHRKQERGSGNSCTYSSFHKYHHSAEILYSTEENLPNYKNNVSYLPGSQHGQICNTLDVNYEPLRRHSTPYLDQNHEQNTQNVFVICDSNMGTTQHCSRENRVSDGSEFLLRRHVDSGMGARFSLGSFASDYRTDTDDGEQDSPTSPIWKLRQDSMSDYTLPVTPAESIFMDNSAPVSNSWRRSSRARGNKGGRVEDGPGLEHTQGRRRKSSPVFRFPPVPPRSRVPGRKKKEQKVRLLAKNPSEGTVNLAAKLARSGSEYEPVTVPDTAMTEIPDDWEASGPTFSETGIPRRASSRRRKGRESNSSNDLERRSLKKNKRNKPEKNTSICNELENQQSGRFKASLIRQRIRHFANGVGRKNTVGSLSHSASVDNRLDSSRCGSKQQQSKASKSENRARKALRTISIILGAFVLCWTPWHVLSLIISVHDDVPLLNLLYDISYWLCYMNSPINPFCYAFVNQQFKKTFVRILKCDWHRT